MMVAHIAVFLLAMGVFTRRAYSGKFSVWQTIWPILGYMVFAIIWLSVVDIWAK